MSEIKFINNLSVKNNISAVSAIHADELFIRKAIASPDFNALKSTIASNSGNWTQSLSFNEEDKTLSIAGSNTISLSGLGGSGSDISGLSSNWQNTYTTVTDNSASWLGGGSDVGGLSSNWENTYTTVRDTSSNWADLDIISPGTFGSATSVPQLFVNSHGKITSVVEQTITPLAIGAAQITHTHNKSDINNFDAEVLSTIIINSNIPNGFLKLDSTAKIPSSFIPGSVNEIVELPQTGPPNGTGDPNKIYITTSDNRVWRWGTSQFVEIVASPGSTDAVPEGVFNQYFTLDRARNASPVKSVNTKTGDITLNASDLGAANEIHTHTSNNITDFVTKVSEGVQNARGIELPLMNGIPNAGITNSWAAVDHVHPTDTSRAPINNPIFTGTVTIPSLSVSDVINDTYNNVLTSSPNWENTYTTVKNNSASWLGGGSDVSGLSSNWENTYTTVKDNSASWMGGGSDISGLSSNWENTYTTVVDNSASWSYQGTDLKGLSSNWQNAFTTLNSNSSNWSYQGSDLKSLSSNWENTYTTVSDNSASWLGGGSDVSGLSSNWENTYTTVRDTSSNWANQPTGVNPGSYGNYNNIATFNVDQYGKISSAIDVAITPDNIGAAQAIHTHNKSSINNFDAEVINVVISNSNQAGKPLLLDSTNRIPTAFLPGSVDEIIEVWGIPGYQGSPDKLYLDLNTGAVYRWSGSQYVAIVSSPGSTDSVSEGIVNRYYTAARVQTDAPVRSVNSKSGDVVLGSEDIGAAPALHSHTASNITDFASNVNNLSYITLQNNKGIVTPPMDGGNGYSGVSNSWAPMDHQHPTDTTRAPINSPTFVGILNAPTINSNRVDTGTISAQNYLGLVQDTTTKSVLTANSGNWDNSYNTINLLSSVWSKASVNYIIDGGSTAITVGSKGVVYIPSNFIVTNWRVYAETTTTTKVDIRRFPNNTYKTTSLSADSILLDKVNPNIINLLTINNNVSGDGNGSIFSNISANDTLEFFINENNNAKRLTISINGFKTI